MVNNSSSIAPVEGGGDHGEKNGARRDGEADDRLTTQMLDKRPQQDPQNTAASISPVHEEPERFFIGSVVNVPNEHQTEQQSKSPSPFPAVYEEDAPPSGEQFTRGYSSASAGGEKARKLQLRIPDIDPLVKVVFRDRSVSTFRATLSKMSIFLLNDGAKTVDKSASKVVCMQSPEMDENTFLARMGGRKHLALADFVSVRPFFLGVYKFTVGVEKVRASVRQFFSGKGPDEEGVSAAGPEGPVRRSGRREEVAGGEGVLHNAGKEHTPLAHAHGNKLSEQSSDPIIAHINTTSRSPTDSEGTAQQQHSTPPDASDASAQRHGHRTESGLEDLREPLLSAPAGGATVLVDARDSLTPRGGGGSAVLLSTGGILHAVHPGMGLKKSSSSNLTDYLIRKRNVATEVSERRKLHKAGKIVVGFGGDSVSSSQGGYAGDSRGVGVGSEEMILADEYSEQGWQPQRARGGSSPVPAEARRGVNVDAPRGRRSPLSPVISEGDDPHARWSSGAAAASERTLAAREVLTPRSRHRHLRETSGREKNPSLFRSSPAGVVVVSPSRVSGGGDHDGETREQSGSPPRPPPSSSTAGVPKEKSLILRKADFDEEIITVAKRRTELSARDSGLFDPAPQQKSFPPPAEKTPQKKTVLSATASKNRWKESLYRPNIWGANIIVSCDVLNAFANGVSLKFMDLFLVEDYLFSPVLLLTTAFVTNVLAVIAAPMSKVAIDKTRQAGYPGKICVLGLWLLGLFFLSIICLPRSFGVPWPVITLAVCFRNALNGSAKGYMRAKLTNFLPTDKIANYMIWDSLNKAHQGGIAIFGAQLIVLGGYRACFWCTWVILLIRIVVFGYFTFQTEREKRREAAGALEAEEPATEATAGIIRREGAVLGGAGDRLASPVGEGRAGAGVFVAPKEAITSKTDYGPLVFGSAGEPARAPTTWLDELPPSPRGEEVHSGSSPPQRRERREEQILEDLRLDELEDDAPDFFDRRGSPEDGIHVDSDGEAYLSESDEEKSPVYAEEGLLASPYTHAKYEEDESRLLDADNFGLFPDWSIGRAGAKFRGAGAQVRHANRFGMKKEGEEMEGRRRGGKGREGGDSPSSEDVEIQRASSKQREMLEQAASNGRPPNPQDLEELRLHLGSPRSPRMERGSSPKLV